MCRAAWEARQAALGAVRPGARAAAVERAAREVLRSRGYAEAFPHPTGHGAGSVSIDAMARPRMHPQSPDRLERGMIFTHESGVYLARKRPLQMILSEDQCWNFGREWLQVKRPWWQRVWWVYRYECPICNIQFIYYRYNANWASLTRECPKYRDINVHRQNII